MQEIEALVSRVCENYILTIRTQKVRSAPENCIMNIQVQRKLINYNYLINLNTLEACTLDVHMDDEKRAKIGRAM